MRISCPLDMTSSVSMPPIDGRIDPLFDCLDNLCEFRHNASRSGFQDVRGGLGCLVSAHLPPPILETCRRQTRAPVRSPDASGCAAHVTAPASHKPSVKFELGSMTLSDVSRPPPPFLSPPSCHWSLHLVSAAVIKMNDSEVHPLCLIYIMNFNSLLSLFILCRMLKL